MRRLALALALGATGCLGIPNPLAPGLHGSIGVPHAGVLEDGAPLPQRGPGFKRLKTDDSRWGHPRLVRLLQHAAKEVARERPGPPLVVADISQKGGGELQGHRSHRTGRDVDILFYALTPSGAPVAAPGFVRYGADGLGKLSGASAGGHKYLRIDVERTWLLVKALLQAPDAGVQWIFLSRPLEALLTEWALARGEDLELVWRAENVMLQPGDSSPHDDHIHLRIACSPDDAVAGCQGGGPYWSWLPALPRLGDVSDEALAKLPKLL